MGWLKNIFERAPGGTHPRPTSLFGNVKEKLDAVKRLPPIDPKKRVPPKAGAGPIEIARQFFAGRDTRNRPTDFLLKGGGGGRGGGAKAGGERPPTVFGAPVEAPLDRPDPMPVDPASMKLLPGQTYQFVLASPANITQGDALIHELEKAFEAEHPELDVTGIRVAENELMFDVRVR